MSNLSNADRDRIAETAKTGGNTPTNGMPWQTANEVDAIHNKNK